ETGAAPGVRKRVGIGRRPRPHGGRASTCGGYDCRVEFVAYHDRTSADHQAQFDDLYPKGWRIASLSVYGARGNERYAAVWVKRPGPDWSAVHGVNGAGYQTAFDNAVAAGFKPALLAETGPAN